MSNQKNPIEMYEDFPISEQTVYFIVNDTLSAPSYPAHWHNYIEIMYIIEGNNIARCSNEIIELGQDEICVINSNEIHQNIGGKRSYAFVLVHPKIFSGHNIVFKRKIQDSYLSNIFKVLISEYNADRYSQLNVEGYGRLITAHLCRNYVHTTLNSKEKGRSLLNQNRFNECIKYIHDNYNKDISLDEVANIARLNKFTFCKLFKDFTGETLIEYQNKLRITKANELLITTNMSITEIAFLCGYNDSNYFSRKFKQITQMSPTEARKQQNNL